jgi:hypothetical protein
MMFDFMTPPLPSCVACMTPTGAVLLVSKNNRLVRVACCMDRVCIGTATAQAEKEALNGPGQQKAAT